MNSASNHPFCTAGLLALLLMSTACVGARGPGVWNDFSDATGAVALCHSGQDVIVEVMFWKPSEFHSRQLSVAFTTRPLARDLLETG